LLCGSLESFHAKIPTEVLGEEMGKKELRVEGKKGQTQRTFSAAASPPSCMLGGLPPWYLLSTASALRTSSEVTLKFLSAILKS
jgi:hypothetical protein